MAELKEEDMSMVYESLLPPVIIFYILILPI